MNKTEDKNMCLFFASDYHFEMITVPYIEKELEKNKEIVVLTEENLVSTIDVLLSRITLNQNKKDRIKAINWSNNNIEKINKLKNNEDKDVVIFIKGKVNYINDMKNNISTYLDKNNIECIDCYDINEVGENAGKIANKYDQVLSTIGKTNL